VSGIAGALFAGQVERPWHAALAGTGASIAGETAWEISSARSALFRNTLMPRRAPSRRRWTARRGRPARCGRRCAGP
jgi:hypothetical protein